MKQKRTKPRPTAPKGKRWPSSYPKERQQYVDELGWVGDCERREYKKSDKYKRPDKFKK